MTLAARKSRRRVPVPVREGRLLAPGYAVIKHLHRGNDLDVYDVWSEQRGCRCVAKTLRPDRVDERGVRRHLLREGRLLQRLTHPHLVRAYETIEEPHPLIVLETLTGETLTHLIRRRHRRMPMIDLAYLGLHLCSAMRYLHGQGYVHLDLKPSNIVSDRGLAKVIDLSIAQRLGRGRTGGATRIYASPEQARHDPVTEATDVWGIGIVLFEATTGRLPFGPPRNSKYEQLERRADSVRRHRRVPPAFAAAMDRCLEPDPGGRPSLDELTGLLRALA